MREMAAYSSTPLWRKLGLAAGGRLALVGAPAGVERLLEPRPRGCRIARGLGRAATPSLVLLFAKSRARLEAEFARVARRLDRDGALWVAWPKRSAGTSTDLTEDVVRGIGLAAGLVDVKVCAIDETWSGLRFVYRLRDRSKSPRPPARRPPARARRARLS